MADSRQTKIVEYKLQGNTVDLERQLGAAITTLDALDRKLTRVATEARMIGGRDATNFKRASAISTAESQIEKLRATVTSPRIEAVSPDQLNLIKQMNAELDNILSNLGRFKSEQNVTQKALDKTVTSLRGVNNSLRNSNILVPKSTTLWQNFTKALGKAGIALAIIRTVLNYFGQLYNAAADYVEVMNLFNVATRESRDELYAFSVAMRDAYNTDIRPIQNSIATFRQYANTMGFVSDQADILGSNLTKITYDLASLYNTTYDDMLKVVKSGLAGQTRPLMQYGISVHKATLEQTALNLGLEKSWSAFSETEKVALRYIAILNQASLAQGDLARTLESPSNQLKIAKAQVQVFIRYLGSMVTIISQYVLPVFNGFMIATNSFLEAMAKAAGYEIPDYSDNLASANQLLDDGTESAEEYEEAMKGILAPLDEINQASTAGSDNSQLGVIDPAILDTLKGYDNLMDRIHTKTDVFAEALAALINPQVSKDIGSVLGTGFETFAAGIDLVASALTAVAPALNVTITLMGYLLQGAAWLIDHVASPTLKFVEALTDNIWLLVAAFALLNLAQLAVTGDFKSMLAIKIVQWFASLTGQVITNTGALIANAAAALKTKIAALVLAGALWWEAAAWWQKAIAVIAAAGAMALVVGGIVTAATSTAQSQANSAMNTQPNVPAMARGGVVSSPTVALIGEGRYREAVVPLGNSPQFKSMKDDIADEVARKTNPYPRGPFGQPSRGVPVILQLNGKEIGRGLIPDINNAQMQTGVILSK